MLISHFNMDSQLILGQKLSHFECASEQNRSRGFSYPFLKKVHVHVCSSFLVHVHVVASDT